MPAALFCGQSSYLRSDSATPNRYRALAEITRNLGFEPIFVNRHAPLRPGESPHFDPEFRVVNVSGMYRRFYWICKLFSFPREALAILRINHRDRIAIINVYTEFVPDLFFYFIIGKLTGARCVIHIVEFRSRIAGRKTQERMLDLVYEWSLPYLFGYFVSISSLLKRNILSKNVAARVAVIPPVCRFGDIRNVKPIGSGDRFFVYCASLAYEDVAWFVIEAFAKLRLPGVSLVLVLNGKLSDRITASLKDNPAIKLYSGLPYEQLLALFKGAHALLIPLRDSVQDCARFPQKITEYLACGRPIISCNVGEVAEHFTNGVDSLLSSAYDVDEYSGLMGVSLSDEVDIEKIAAAGYRRGMELFDVGSQEENLKLVLT